MIVKLTNTAKQDLFHLFYFPFTMGRQMEYSVNVFREIVNTIAVFSPMSSIGIETITGVGVFYYSVTGGVVIINRFVWNPPVRKFFFTKSNFIRFTSARDISSAHPSFYQECNESSFDCDNGYKVVKRTVRGNTVYNFKDLDGCIISDIDFTQVKPFSSDYDMTARGFTPNRRCYIVYPSGEREETNESVRKKNVTVITESDLRMMVRETLRRILHN